MLQRVASELLDVWAFAHIAGRRHIPSHHLNFEEKIKFEKIHSVHLSGHVVSQEKMWSNFPSCTHSLRYLSLMSDNRDLCVTVDLSANYTYYFEYLCGN